MNDHEIIEKLVEYQQMTNDSVLEQHSLILALLPICAALVNSHPNKDVLKTNFYLAWKALDGHNAMMRLSPQKRALVLSALGDLAQVTQENYPC